MNGGHDLGGMHGLGPIGLEEDEPVFHDEWEGRTLALTLAAGSRGEWNQDKSRFARESMEPGEYLRTSYYEHWLHGLEVLLQDAGHIAPGEIEQRMADGPVVGASPGFADERVLPVSRVALTLGRGGRARMDNEGAARFKPGDVVRTININPPYHTRLPRYARDKQGVIELDHGSFIFPDTHAREGKKEAVRLYAVRFRSVDLWGEADGNVNDTILLDMFDPYLIESSV